MWREFIGQCLFGTIRFRQSLSVAKRNMVSMPHALLELVDGFVEAEVIGFSIIRRSGSADRRLRPASAGRSAGTPWRSGRAPRGGCPRKSCSSAGTSSRSSCRFRRRVVVGVFRLPVAAGEFEDVLQGAVGVDVDLLPDDFLLLGDEHPAVRLGRGGEEIQEGGFRRPFMVCAHFGVVPQRREVLADRGGVGFDLRGHHAEYTGRENERLPAQPLCIFRGSPFSARRKP